MLTTRDPVLDRQFRLLRQHGVNIPAAVRHSANAIISDEYSIVGFNYQMTDIQAAVGRVQLKRLPEILNHRVALAARYTKNLKAIPGLKPPSIPPYIRPNYQSYPVRVTADYPLSRDKLMQALLQCGISTRRGIMNAHQEPAYAEMGPFALPHSEAARDEVLLLPLYDELSDDEIMYVIDCLHARSSRG
jgi:dTDP-4-amino-4,6-dideoxygalactose transaminase